MKSRQELKYDSNVKKNSYILGALTIAIFGPYIVQGVRTEQVLVYILFPISLGLILTKKRNIIFIKPIFMMSLTIMLLNFWYIVVTILGGNSNNVYSLVAGLESSLQPAIVIVITATFINLKNKIYIEYTTQKVMCLFITLLCVNSIVTIITSITKDISFLSMFHSGYVPENSLQMGRYTGIFNQPLESGLTYSLGIICYIYLERKKTLVEYIKLGLLILGGLLSVSKVFILGGLFLATIYFCINLLKNKLIIRIKFTDVIIIIIIFFASIKILLNWNGLSYILRLFNYKYIVENGILNTLTSGRFGNGLSHVSSSLQEVLTNSPVYGFGIGSMNGPIDNAYLDVIYQGGLVAMIIYVGLFLIILTTSIRAIKISKFNQGNFLIILVIFLVLAGLGGPVISINRFSTILWIIVTLVMAKICI